MADVDSYIGGELELFKKAVNWKEYWCAQIRPFIGKRVIEVGAGLGTNTPYMAPEQSQWICLEPDGEMAAAMTRAIKGGLMPGGCEVVNGTLLNIPADFAADTILYIDVLEHIEDDKGELIQATERLAPGGHLIVLSPAHQFLFSPFDHAIGHHRRYSRKSLTAITNADLEQVRLRYLDSVGFFASLANRLLLQKGMPSESQIALWDRFMVPPSKGVDPLLGYHFGKTVLGIWRRRG